MKLYLISYDLNKPGKNYSELLEELRALGAKRILLSQWVLRSAHRVSDLRDDLKRLMDTNDRLLIVEISGGWASRNTMVDIREL